MFRCLSNTSIKCSQGMFGYAASYSSCGPKVAVVLSGCGVYDGSEVHEASSILIHLTRHGAVPECYAPDIKQMHVINHAKGCPAKEETRNVFVESARIARGNIRPLCMLTAAKAEALVIPGGFGAAKNLSDFATCGTAIKVDVDVERVMNEFHRDKKFIALCCIAPILAAKVFPSCTITLGKKEENGHWPHAAAIDAATSLGANHVEKAVCEVAFDEKNKIITSPAFMYEGKYYEIYEGIGNMINVLMGHLKGHN